ncbi:MAG TPA: DegT/DnrJ/EryC1/StrS family aminotransferase, partial [Pirellulales bacterium]|nr:DegT/DnrJ/EryC1/StrS family aminotransferase [Pirellulales bacterium]
MIDGTLAIDGGPPTFPSGPPTWPLADPDVRTALEQAFADGSWGRYAGPNAGRLASALAEYHQVEYVSLCCSGTFAVELALRALQVGAG